jgi:hypothetical protein
MRLSSCWTISLLPLLFLKVFLEIKIKVLIELSSFYLLLPLLLIFSGLLLLLLFQLPSIILCLSLIELFQSFGFISLFLLLLTSYRLLASIRLQMLFLIH